ncbi:YceI family protein [Staphylococcus aureus]
MKATATIIPSSINTKNEARDNHLKSGDFFGTDEFDKITFETKSVSESKVVGDLTIKGITNEETFDDVAVEGDINDFSTLKATATIIPSSINTKNEARDNHLKSGDFFGTDEFDKITFETKSVSESKVVGDLTIKGITNEETFDVEFNGVSKNPMDGSQVTGVIVTGTINREKYGINFNQALETGGVMLGKDVKFEASAEFSISE